MTVRPNAYLCKYLPPFGGLSETKIVIAKDTAEAAKTMGTPEKGEIVITSYEVVGLPDPPVLPRMIDEMLEELQAIGSEFGILGGEKRTEGIRRVLTAQRDTIAKIHAICERYEERYADPGRHMDDIRDVLGRRDPLNKAYRDAAAGAAGVMRMLPDGNVEHVPSKDWRADG